MNQVSKEKSEPTFNGPSYIYKPATQAGMLVLNRRSALASGWEQEEAASDAQSSYTE
jgi:hypothetical protein